MDIWIQIIHIRMDIKNSSSHAQHSDSDQQIVAEDYPHHFHLVRLSLSTKSVNHLTMFFSHNKSAF
jgi:hypothetical protein